MRVSVAVLAAVGAAVAGLSSPSASAVTSSDPCISGSGFTLALSRSSVVWGQSVTLSSGQQAAAGCSISTFLQFTDTATGVAYSESLAASEKIYPPSTGHYDMYAVDTATGMVTQVSTVNVQVAFPTVSGHPWVRITPTAPDAAATFANAVQQSGAQVYIRGDVNLDLSGMADIHVAPGVQIIGERDADHPHGPRLFTTTFPDQLLEIGDSQNGSTADNVRITGVVLDGGEPSDPCASAGDGVPGSNAISVYSSRHVEIDHSELFHWRGAGVSVSDNDAGDNPGAPARDALNQNSFASGVWVYDNYIHDNMHPTSCSLTGTGLGLGYGVVVGSGGFAYIQGNVFDHNRHAIAGTGKTGDGYIAIGNLFLNPGLNKDRDGLEVIYNHQIDMHGTMTCGDEGHDCGQGGLYQEVENNTVVGDLDSAALGITDAAAIHLRGQPTNVLAGTGWPFPRPTNPGLPPGFGMYVHDNTFNGSEAAELTETGSSFGLIHGAGNVFVPSIAQLSFAKVFYDPSSQGPSCDFDGDGTPDAFRNSAGTFWYFSSRLGRWTYLATNNVSSDGLTFSDVNGDGLCDVSNASGVVYVSPTLFEPFPLSATVPHVAGGTQADAEDAIAAAGLKFDGAAAIASLSPPGTVLFQSLRAGTSVQAGTAVTLTVSAGGVVLPDLTGMTEADARTTLINTGLAVGDVAYSVSTSRPGTVYTQNPATYGGTIVVVPGTTVSFAVSLGQVTVPYIKGDTDADAQRAITNAGLSVGNVSSTGNCVDPGTVQIQNPLNGVQVAVGSPVNYTLSTCTSGGGGGAGGGGGSGGGGGGRGPILPK